MKLKRRFRSYQEKLIQDLKDPKFADAYLNQAAADSDPSQLLLALKFVSAAQGLDISKLARQTQLSRQNLTHMLSNQGNPHYLNMLAVLHAVGYSLAVHRIRK